MRYEGQEEIVLIPRREFLIWGKIGFMIGSLIVAFIALLVYIFFIEPELPDPSLINRFIAVNLFVTSFPLVAVYIIIRSFYPPTVVMNEKGIYFHQKFGSSRINEFISADGISKGEFGRTEIWILAYINGGLNSYKRKQIEFQQKSTSPGLIIHLLDKSRYIICLSWYENDINKQTKLSRIINGFCQEVYNIPIEKTTEEWDFIIDKGEQIRVKPPLKMYFV